MILEDALHISLSRHQIPAELRQYIEEYMYVTFRFTNSSIRPASIEWGVDPEGATFLYGPIAYWDTSRVTSMTELFDGWDEFNGEIENWDISNVTDISWMFRDAYSFNQPLNKWNVSNVIDMGHAFHGARRFNQPLNDWDVSNVTRMDGTFYCATNFNQPLDRWDVSSCITMKEMFYGAQSFDPHSITNWNTINVKTTTNMLTKLCPQRDLEIFLRAQFGMDY